jgi:hypothetical protein
MTNNPPNKLPDPRFERELSVLRDMPPRDPQAEQRGRDRFLAEVKSTETAAVLRQNKRLPIWNTIQTFLSGKMKPGFALSPIIAVIVAATLLLAVAGTTVSASQNSQPDQALYPVKLWSEDLRLQFAGDVPTRMQLDQEFTGRRVAEMIRLAQSGQVAGAVVTDRLQLLVDDAIQNATTLNADGSKKALENLVANLQRHQEQLVKLKDQANPTAVAEFTRLVAILNLKQQLADQGIKDPQALRDRMQQMKKKDQDLPGNPGGPQGKGNSDRTRGPDKTDAPGEDEKNKGNGNGPGAQSTKTPPHATGPQTPARPPSIEGKGKGDGGGAANP